MNKIAQQISWLGGFQGTAALFKLTPPMTLLCGDTVETAEYVVVSAVNTLFSGPETYVFPATAEGKVVSWQEWPGSFRGSLDIWQALRNADYEPRGIAVSDDAERERHAGWLRAVDEAMVTYHAGVVEAGDSYEAAKGKLNTLLCIVQDIGAHHERERCAAWVEARRDAFCDAHGSIDPDTGTLEFGRGQHADAKSEYVGELEEIAAGLRALKA